MIDFNQINEKELKRRKILGDEWFEVLGDEFEEPYMKKLNEYLRSDQLEHKINPPLNSIFNGFKATPYSKVRVVIVGQDPYPNNHANGVAFASNIGLPKSLKLIFDNLEKEFGKAEYRDTGLKYLTDQGVLLLNSRLTVRQNQPNSHSNIGWQIFIIRVLSELTKKPICFVAVGSMALNLLKNQLGLLVNDNFFYCEHPSYAARENRAWKDNDIFKKVNNFFKLKNQEQIKW